MLKKIFKNCCLTLIMLISIGILSACCSPKKYNANVVFDGIDPNMGVENFVTQFEYGDAVDIEFAIPEGYNHVGMSATLNGNPYDFEVVLGDSTLQEDYQYATVKTIKMHINKLIKDAEIRFDMSQVRKMQFDVKVDGPLLKTMETNTYNKYSTNLKALIVEEEAINSLRKLNKEDVVEEIDFTTDTLTFDYGKIVLLAYDIGAGLNDVETMFSSAGYFADENRVKEISTIKYVPYDVAKLGNTYYHIHDGNDVDEGSRLYYIGKIQEDITLYDYIPSYEEEKGFKLDNNENKFSLLTNMQEYNSSLLSINVYQPSNISYSASDESIDKIGTQTIQKIEKYNSSGDLKNPSLLYNIYNRYDVYNMYVGDDIENDTLLSTSEKSVLTSELYVSIGTTENVENLNIRLLTYEKQTSAVPSVTITEFITSEKGEVFFKLDKSVVETFLLDRGTRGDNNEIIEYQTGNAILFVDLSEYIEECRMNGTNIYSAINYPIFLSASGHEYNDYRVEIFLMDENGNRNYGFLDLNSYHDDYVYFTHESIWNEDWSYKDNVYISVYGPEYSGYSNPVISSFNIYINDPRHSTLNPRIYIIEDAKELNGVECTKLNIAGESGSPYSGHQYRVDVEIQLTEKIDDAINLNFTQLVLGGNEKVFVTNNSNFRSFEDFAEISSTNLTSDVRFGLETDLFYFVVSYLNFDFDIYLRSYDEESGTYSDELQLAASTHKLLDVVGNEVKIEYEGKEYNVFVKHQTNNIYENIGSTYWAYEK